MWYNAYIVYDRNNGDYIPFETEEAAREYIKESIEEYGDSVTDFFLFKREMLEV